MQRLEADYKSVTDKEKEEVVSLGGLHVVGTERHVRSLHLGGIHSSMRSMYTQKPVTGEDAAHLEGLTNVLYLYPSAKTLVRPEYDVLGGWTCMCLRNSLLHICLLRGLKEVWGGHAGGEAD